MLGGDAVAVYSNGAAGDHNPIYFNQTYDLRAIRTADYVLDIGPGAGVHGGRILAQGTPDEVAGMAVFLASDEARFLNGLTIPVDNGLYARPHH